MNGPSFFSNLLVVINTQEEALYTTSQSSPAEISSQPSAKWSGCKKCSHGKTSNRISQSSTKPVNLLSARSTMDSLGNKIYLAIMRITQLINKQMNTISMSHWLDPKNCPKHIQQPPDLGMVTEAHRYATKEMPVYVSVSFTSTSLRQKHKESIPLRIQWDFIKPTGPNTQQSI